MTASTAATTCSGGNTKSRQLQYMAAAEQLQGSACWKPFHVCFANLGCSCIQYFIFTSRPNITVFIFMPRKKAHKKSLDNEELTERVSEQAHANRVCVDERIDSRTRHRRVDAQKNNYACFLHTNNCICHRQIETRHFKFLKFPSSFGLRGKKNWRTNTAKAMNHGKQNE